MFQSWATGKALRVHMFAVERIKPKFWDHRDVAAGPYRHLFNFRRIWKLTVLLTAGVTLVPLISITLIDYNVTQHAMESEILLRTSRLVSNTRRTVSFFLAERKSALDFIDNDNVPFLFLSTSSVVCINLLGIGKNSSPFQWGCSDGG